MAKPKVSVVIPVYNAEKYLHQCLDSIINQTLTDIEIICVDDGSTDSSVEILKNYKQKDQRIKILQQKNQFAGVARNNGLKIARGEWVTFIDSDDFCELDGLENLYKKATENSLDFIKCSSYCYNEVTQIDENRDWYLNKRAEKIFNIITDFSKYPEELSSICDTPWSGLYRTSFLQENNIIFPNFRCVNDHSFFIECLLKAKRMMVSDIYLTHYRVDREGSLVNKKHLHFEDQIRNYDRVKAIATKTNKSNIKNFLLRKELYQLLKWYKVLINRNTNRFNLENRMVEFCHSFDVNDVGERFLKNFTFAKEFSNLQNKTTLEFFREEVKNPKISVVIPVYNTEQYLHACIESLLRQTLKEIEIICIDDGSTDGSYELLEEYAESFDKRIKVVKNEQKGVMHARKLGCDMARAPYIQFLDSDDWLTDNALEELYNASINCDYDMCLFQHYAYDDNDSKIINISSGIDDAFLPSKPCFSMEDCKETIFQINSSTLCWQCYRKDFIKQFMHLTLDLVGTEDYPVACYSSLFAKKIKYLSMPLYYYRKNRDNSLESAKDSYPLYFYKGYKRFFEIIQKTPFYHEIKKSYVNRQVRGCFYHLTSKKTSQGYYRTYKFLKRWGFKGLDLLDYPEQYYYNRNTYNMLYYMCKYDFIFHKTDLLKLVNDKVSAEDKEKIVKKYQFIDSLKKASYKTKSEVMLDRRMSNINPHVSVIVPVYNTETYLTDCLTSLKKQSLTNIEIICVNDGSTDNSLDILKKFAETDIRFIVISQENAGVSVARNTGIKVARGEYLYFIDSDDMLQKNALERLYQEANDQKLDVIFFNTEVLFQSPKLKEKHTSYLKYYERKNNYDGVINGKILMAKMLESKEYLPSPCLSLIDRKFFSDNDLWFLQGILHEDNFYTFKALYSAVRAGYMPDKFYIRRIRDDSIVSSAKRFAHVYGYFFCILKILDFIKTKKQFAEDLVITEKVLAILQGEAYRIYHSLSKEDQETRYLLNGYEQIQMTNLVVNYKKVKSDVKSGYSFRIGRVITYVSRKVRGGIKCYKEHGLVYTSKRVVQKIKNKL